MLNRFSMIKNGATRARVSYRGLPVYNWNPYPQSTSENVRTFNFFPVFFFICLLFFYLFIYLVIYLSLSFIIIITCIITLFYNIRIIIIIIIIIVCFSVFITLCLDLVVGKKKQKQTNKKHQIPSASLTVLQFVEGLNMKKQI